MGDGTEVVRQAHNLEIAGSSPAPPIWGNGNLVSTREHSYEVTDSGRGGTSLVDLPNAG